MEEEFVESKKRKNNKKSIKNKYKSDFEEHWNTLKIEHELKASQKYDDANKGHIDVSLKKIAVATAMKRLEEKKEKIFHEYIINREADEQYLKEINEDVEESFVIKTIKEEKINLKNDSMFSNLTEEDI